MTPRHQRLSQQATPAAAPHRKTARLRWFLVAHVLAVLGLYATALYIGGGLAPPPFPSNRPHVPTRMAATAAPSGVRMAPAAGHGPREALVVPTAAPDLAPPWALDGAATQRID